MVPFCCVWQLLSLLYLLWIKKRKKEAASGKTWAQIFQPLFTTYPTYLFKESHVYMSLTPCFFNTPMWYELCFRSWRWIVG